MKKEKILLSGLMLLVILSSFTRIREIVEDFNARVSSFYHEKIGSVLFLHTDKSIYVPNESIWFKAYLLSSSPMQHEVLYLRLVNDKKQIVLQQEFPIYDIRSNGDILLPVTIAPGRYRLVAYTDKMINFSPENVFVQQIQVIKDHSFESKAEASIADSTNFSAGKRPEIIVKVSANNRQIEKATGTYKIYTSNKKTIIEGKFVTGPDGIAALSFMYPLIAENEELFLQFKIADNNWSKDLNIRLPKTAANVSVNCYPEGGHLVNGISNRVLIAVIDGAGQPVTAKVALRSQTKQIANTTTNIDGTAVISFTPDIKDKYSLAINNAGNHLSIPFPLKTDPSGYVIQLAGTPDRPMIMVKNQNMQPNTRLLGRTLSELKLDKSLALKNGDSIMIALPQNDSVNHVIDFGLFDAENKLLANRLIYIPAPEKYHITIHLDKADYKPRQKVQASISVTDVNGNPVAANLSVAVVAKHTLDPAVVKRITETDLNALSYYQTNLKGINDINNELIREDIRVGNWAAIMNFQPNGQIKMFSNTAGVFGSFVSKKNKKISLETLHLYRQTGITPVTVNTNGTFSIPSKDLITQNGDSNYLIVNDDFNEKYDLHIKNYAGDFDLRIVTTSLPESLPAYDLIRHSAQLSSVVSGKVLREVVIKGSKSITTTKEDFNAKDYHSVSCSDYVCFNNILNCKVHPGGRLPAEGQIYVLNGRPIRYHGCASKNESKKNTYLLKNINTSQTFYLPDYSTEPISAPELQSTIFWEPNFNIQANGKGTVEFYTSDIRGQFTIIVQGLTLNGLIPIYRKYDFN